MHKILSLTCLENPLQTVLVEDRGSLWKGEAPGNGERHQGVGRSLGC